MSRSPKFSFFKEIGYTKLEFGDEIPTESRNACAAMHFPVIAETVVTFVQCACVIIICELTIVYCELCSDGIRAT